MNEFESTPTLEGLQAAFGITADTPTSTEEPESQGTETVPEAAPESTAPEDQGSENPQAEVEQPTEQPTPSQQFQQNRQQQANQAFARMRTENAAMLKSLQTTAQILGINPNLPPDQLSNAIQEQANAAIARKNNMDPAILNRLNELEAINARYQQAELEKQLMKSLDDIKTQFGATDDDLTVFVQTLDKEGYDPMKSGADLTNEFIKRNFNTIIKNKVDMAVRAEQERASKASGASKPSSKQGQEDNTEPKKVETQADFDDFMNSLVN